MNNKIYSIELAGKPRFHNCKIHNNLPALALVLLSNLYTYRNIGKHQPALFPLSEIRNWDK
jgi:hypothetical protein